MLRVLETKDPHDARDVGVGPSTEIIYASMGDGDETGLDWCRVQYSSAVCNRTYYCLLFFVDHANNFLYSHP